MTLHAKKADIKNMKMTIARIEQVPFGQTLQMKINSLNKQKHAYRIYSKMIRQSLYEYRCKLSIAIRKRYLELR